MVTRGAIHRGCLAWFAVARASQLWMNFDRELELSWARALTVKSTRRGRIRHLVLMVTSQGKWDTCDWLIVDVNCRDYTYTEWILVN